MQVAADFRLRIYAVGIFGLGMIGLFFTLQTYPIIVTPSVLALALVAMLADALTVQLSSVSVSMTHPVLAASCMLLGPGAGGAVAALSAMPSALTVRDKPIVRALVNVGQLAVSYTAAGWVYVLARGRLLQTTPLDPAETPRVLLPLLLLAITAFLLNTTLVGIAVSLNTGIPFLAVWKSSFAWTIPTQAALTVLALALAQVVASEGILGLGLFLVPLLIARQFYERYLTLKKTYADTVRSLVAVIEAKDSYTRGHSERVAAYCVDIARRLGFSDQRIERMELAALLHDLGKVGISRTILSKDSQLSHEEFEVIKTHPDIGAQIIESVPFLVDLVPVISSHHERVDGSGYGAHLAGDEIPIEARVLGVADAFDAMTSSRPYRAAMSRAETIQELRRCSGTQFDQVIVETFVEALGDTAEADLSKGEGAVCEAV